MLDSPGTLLMNIDGPTAHAIQASGEDDGFFVTGSYGTLRTSITNTVRIIWSQMVSSTSAIGVLTIPTGEALRAPLIQIIIFIFFEMALQIIMVEFLNIVPTGNSPNPYIDDHPYFVMLDGNVNGVNLMVWGSCGRKYFVTLRLPTQLETVYFMLKLMEEVI